MVDRIFTTVSNWSTDLVSLASWHWNHMTPEKYTIVLITVGVFGWILMKGEARR